MAYSYRHTVSFEETNLLGNVYYTEYLRWQGKCREQFLAEHTPELVERLGRDLQLATTHCECDYFDELNAFDEVDIRMRLESLTRSRIQMGFEYIRVNGEQGDDVVAHGTQEIAVLSIDDGELSPMEIPEALSEALKQFE